MAIRQVNGRNAYVIEVEQPTARTSRGEGYAQLITNLRWKMWEEAQKSELMALEFEKLAYQQQLKIYADQQRLIRGEIAKTNAAINALNRAELTRDQQLENNLQSAENAEARRVAQAREARLRQQSSQEFAGQEQITTTERETAGSGGRGAKTQEELIADLSSDSQDSFQRVREISTRAAASETDEEQRIRTQASEATTQTNFQLGEGGGITAGDERTMKAAVVAASVKDARDRAIADGRDPNAAEQSVLSAYGADYVADYQSFQTAPEETPPAGGAGGDLLEGTSTRQQREAKPIQQGISGAGVGKAEAVDYSKERERLQKELLDLQAELGGLQLPTAPSVDLLERTRGKFQSAYGEGGFGLAPRPTRMLPRFDEPAATRAAQDIAAFGADKALADFRAANPDVELNPQQIASIRRQGVLGMLNQLGGREVAEQDFLDFRTTEPATLPPPKTREPELPPMEEEEPIAQEPMLTRPVPQRIGLPASQLPVSGELEQQLLEEDRMREMQGLPPQRYGSSFQPVQKTQTAADFLAEMRALGFEEQALQRLQMEQGIQEQGASAYYQQQIPTETYQAPPTFGERVSSLIPTPVDRRTEAGIAREEELAQMPSQRINPFTGQVKQIPSRAERDAERAAQRAETTMDRRNAYKIKMIEKATRLANQPKKFERIAKTNLPPEERARKVADYVIVVDNLYAANSREGGDPIQPSYAEINRVYADDPKTREQATSYLLAKQILDTTIQNPE